MQVKFWGVRGSIPSPNHSTDIRWKLREILAAAGDCVLNGPDNMDRFISDLPYHLLYPVGDNTSCVEVSFGEDRIILDAGSGLRQLGLELSRQEHDLTEKDFYLALESGQDLSDYTHRNQSGGNLSLTLLLSHTHWDHIQGFPFFTPAYRSGNRLAIYGLNSEQLAWAFKTQQTAPALFPIPLEGMGAQIDFHNFPEEGLTVGNLKIQACPLPHPGGCLAYRISAASKTLIYATDYEFSDPDSEEAGLFTDFIAGADVMISDTQYTYLESVAKEGWGHSTSFSAMDLAMKAGVRGFFLFHHDPEHSDAKLLDNLDKTRAYYLMMSDRGNMRIELAVEGLSLDI